MTQLQELSKPFPKSLVKKAPSGKYGDYVKHSTVTERLLSIVGPFDFEIVEIVRGYAPPVKGKGGTKDRPTYPGRDNAIVGCLARLTLTIDGDIRTVTETGDVEEPAMNTDGRNLKDASSDAIKRCAMRFGLGLHLWSQDDYFLEKQLSTGDPDSDNTQDQPTEDQPAEAPPSLAEKRMKKVKDAAWIHTTGADDNRIVETKRIVAQVISQYGGEPHNQTDVDAIISAIDEMFTKEDNDDS